MADKDEVVSENASDQKSKKLKIWPNPKTLQNCPSFKM